MAEITPEMRKAFFDVMYEGAESSQQVEFLNACSPELFDKAIKAAVNASRSIAPDDLRERLTEIILWHSQGYGDFPALTAYAEKHLANYGIGSLRAAEEKTLLETAKLILEMPAFACGSEIAPSDVEWVVNDLSELGVKIGDRFFFLYKGESLVYEEALHDDTKEPMRWRPVGKREFGEVCEPLHHKADVDDGNEWHVLPARKA